MIVTSSRFCEKPVSSQIHRLPRCGIALALNKLSQHLDSSQVKPLFQFFVPDALNDRSPEVRKCMLDAALSTLNTHGKVSLDSSLSSGGKRWNENVDTVLEPVDIFFYFSENLDVVGISAYSGSFCY